MKCRECIFISEPKTFREGDYPSVRCTQGIWDKNGVKHWYSFGECQLNRGPVRRYGDACREGKDKTAEQKAQEFKKYIGDVK